MESILLQPSLIIFNTDQIMRTIWGRRDTFNIIWQKPECSSLLIRGSIISCWRVTTQASHAGLLSSRHIICPVVFCHLIICLFNWVYFVHSYILIYKTLDWIKLDKIRLDWKNLRNLQKMHCHIGITLVY